MMLTQFPPWRKWDMEGVEHGTQCARGGKLRQHRQVDLAGWPSFIVSIPPSEVRQGVGFRHSVQCLKRAEIAASCRHLGQQVVPLPDLVSVVALAADREATADLVFSLEGKCGDMRDCERS